MCIFAKISPSIKLTARLSCNNIRRYTCLVQVQQRLKNGEDHIFRNNLPVRRFCLTNKSDVTYKRFSKVIKNELLNTSPESSIMPIALIDLNPLNNNSSKVLLIPLNWQEADLRNTITSIFSKPKNLQQIEAFSQALKEIPNFQKSKGNEVQKSQNNKNLEPKEQLHLKVPQLSKNKNVNSISVDNLNDLEARLATEIEKSLQQCCLHSMQMFVDNCFFGERITGLKFLSTLSKSDFGESMDFNSLNNVNMTQPLNTVSVMKINNFKLNLKDISCDAKIPFPEVQNSNIMLPLSFTKKLYSTKSTASLQQNTLTKDLFENSQILDTLYKSPTQKIVNFSIQRTASNISNRSKCKPNYDYPYLSKLFGTKQLLMSCDAYNNALIEAAKRRAAITECTASSEKLKPKTNGRPQVTSIKGCNAQNKLETAIETPKSCPPPKKIKKQASDGCKKDDPCKPPECPNPCKDEMEKLKRQSDEEIRKKRKKMPTGCESPKCKKEDNCTKLQKSPCKKAKNQQTSGAFNCPSKSSADVKKLKDGCKKDDPCKPPQCPNPCKDEMEKIKRQTDEAMKRKRKRTPTGCISPKCKKEDYCNKLKKSPCKKASDCDTKGLINSKESLKCAKKDGGSKDKAPKNPCLDDHTEYKPKCNPDPCKQNQKEDSCKKKDPCGSSKQQDPCKKKDKGPCGSKKEDPCKKKKDDPCKKKKEDPCGGKKNDPCGSSKQQDPCKKKDKGPCGSKKEDPCKKKDKGPCGSKKEDPCKKKKDDPCKKKKNSPCVSAKKTPTSPCVSAKKTPTSPCKPSSKKQACGKPTKETKPNCGQDKKCFSTLTASIIRRTFTTFTVMPSLKNKNLYSFGFMRNYSSKTGGNKKNKRDLGKASQCKSVETTVPPKRKPAYNPHPKDGLRKCYPTYDMDCRKLCKEPRKTDCKKYAFLKDTDDNKRKSKK